MPKKTSPPTKNIKLKCDAELIIADSESDADMLYASGFFVPDPFIYFKTSKGSAVVMSDLEYSRALRQAKVKKVYSLSEINSEIKKQAKFRSLGNKMADIANWILKKEGAQTLRVPANFPLQYADPLRKRFRVHYEEEPFFGNRAVKKDNEIKSIRESLKATEKGFTAGLKILKNASIGDNKNLYYSGKALKAEDIRAEINSTIAALGYSVSHTIVSCGKHACDPHDEGSGPLKAHETIIIDIFPRSDRTGYFGDFTRTVVKGKASDLVKKAYQRVREGQNIAFQMIRHGMDGEKIHQAICDHFAKNGFPNKEGKRGKEGFIHGTGHGLGLGLHEYPRIHERSCRLKAGNVVTVEPGLYYRNMGGVRLEDVVVVTKEGCKNLTRFPKVLEIG